MFLLDAENWETELGRNLQTSIGGRLHPKKTCQIVRPVLSLVASVQKSWLMSDNRIILSKLINTKECNGRAAIVGG
jgi:hypothetical protein